MTPRLDLLDLLADRLETEKRIPFYYGLWVGKTWKLDPDIGCGTTACAGGLATTMPEFRALGLRLVPDIDSNGQVAGGYVALELHNGLTETGTQAMATALNITHDEALSLFIPSSTDAYRPARNAAAAEVAAHIRRFVARKRKEMGT